jgi:5-methylcytosine-specific restriction endonuclease McrA
MQKECRKCGEVKDVSEFNKHRRRKDGLSDWCKTCQSDYYKVWRKSNKERLSEYHTTWCEDNRERWLQIRRVADKKYRQTERGKIYYRLKNQNRNYRKKYNTTPGDRLTTTQIEYLTEIYTHCAYCDTPLTPDNTHIEHIQPLSKGGAHSIDNVVLACKNCNLSKGAKTLDQWLADTGYTLTINHNIPST